VTRVSQVGDVGGLCYIAGFEFVMVRSLSVRPVLGVAGGNQENGKRSTKNWPQEATYASSDPPSQEIVSVARGPHSRLDAAPGRTIFRAGTTALPASRAEICRRRVRAWGIARGLRFGQRGSCSARCFTSQRLCVASLHAAIGPSAVRCCTGLRRVLAAAARS
jgi:hypothetical protein